MMFGFQKYLEKLYNLKLYFDASVLSSLEELFCVKFKQENDYYLISEVYYSYIDILLGLEKLDFIMNKKDDEVIVHVL